MTKPEPLSFNIHYDVSTSFPEWTPELEKELRQLYLNAPPETPPGGASKHTGIKAVYDRLKEMTNEDDTVQR